MQPMTDQERHAWRWTVGLFGYEKGYWMFMFWHLHFVKD